MVFSLDRCPLNGCSASCRLSGDSKSVNLANVNKISYEAKNHNKCHCRTASLTWGSWLGVKDKRKFDIDGMKWLSEIIVNTQLYTINCIQLVFGKLFAYNYKPWIHQGGSVVYTVWTGNLQQWHKQSIALVDWMSCRHHKRREKAGLPPIRFLSCLISHFDLQ